VWGRGETETLIYSPLIWFKIGPYFSLSKQRKILPPLPDRFITRIPRDKEYDSGFEELTSTRCRKRRRRWGRKR